MVGNTNAGAGAVNIKLHITLGRVHVARNHNGPLENWDVNREDHDETGISRFGDHVIRPSELVVDAGTCA